MGDPRKQRKKFRGPSHPWQKLRIEEEKIVLKEFGLKNKVEIWRMSSLLKNFAQQAKRLNVQTKGSDLERKELQAKLRKLGLLKETGKLEDVLTLTLKDILERRLQTLVYKRGLARSVKDARQMITHKHIMVNGKKITSPAYLVTVTEQDSIAYAGNSPFHDPAHPRRTQAVPKPEAKPAEEKAEKAEKAEAAS